MNLALLRNKQMFVLIVLAILTLVAIAITVATTTNSLTFFSEATAVIYPHP